ncbi:MAG: nucleotide exchange factor GrpE [Actinobacteria bacterium]|nr:nucleotide exchange factor GrpE [Actinomycetota bacterium]
MSEKGHDEQEPGGRPKVKVTDRRRVRADERPPAEGGEAPGGEAHPQLPPETPADLEEELAAARGEAAEYLDHLRRLQAEFENYRKRVLKEQTRALEMASEPLVRKLLEVLDEFQLALMAAEERPDFDKFLRGVELVYAKLMESLKSEGLKRIEAEGKPFDPERHEALMGSSGGDGELVVADVLREGYELRGRVIRPAGVRVTHEA